MTGARKAVAVAGEIAAGKSTFVSAVRDSLHLPVASFGALVRIAAIDRGLDAEDRSVLQDLGEQLYDQLGPEGLLAAALSNAHTAGAPALVIDGVRHDSVADAITRRYEMFLVFVDVSRTEQELRWSRREPSDALDLGAALAHSVEAGTDSLRSRADLVVTTDPDSIASGLGRIRQFLRQR